MLRSFKQLLRVYRTKVRRLGAEREIDVNFDSFSPNRNTVALLEEALRKDLSSVQTARSGTAFRGALMTCSNWQTFLSVQQEMIRKLETSR